MIPRPLISAVVLAACSVPLPVSAQGEYAYDKAPIRYSETDSQDPVALLDLRMESGGFTLTGNPRQRLERILAELKVPQESQVLVFSKTSLQDAIIKPSNPRALYYSDDCYIGWVPGGQIEAVAIDPKLGPVFYFYEPRPPEEQPSLPLPNRFVRDQDCLRCHGTFFTERVPGLFIRSVLVDDRGFPLPHAGSSVVDHTVPISERWGGYYVTGRHGSARHFGNMFAEEKENVPTFDKNPGANLDDLQKFFDVAVYPQGTSDIVALMVLEHQVAAQTALTRADYGMREALHRQSREELTEAGPPDEPRTEIARKALADGTRLVLDAFLFKDEATLPPEGVQGRADFATAFAAHAPKTKAGQSLKQLDLKTRLFTHRCSYLIHGTSFRHLHPALRKNVLAQLRTLLSADKPDERYAYLPLDERQQIAAILSETVEGFAVK